MPDNIFVRNIPADILARALNNIEDVTLSNLTRFQILSMFLSMSLTTSKTVHLNLYANNLNHLPNHILVSAVSKLKSLTLGPLDQDKVTSIMTSLRKGTNLSYLDFGDSDLTDVHPEVLAKGLVRVETVNLMCTRLYTNQITELCKEMAKEDIALKHLHLQHDLRDVPSDILSKAINQLETEGILACIVNEAQTKAIFTEISKGTKVKRINFNNLRAPLIMPRLAKVSDDTIAKAVNKLEDVHIQVGDADNEMSPNQIKAILQKAADEKTNLKKAVIFSDGNTIPQNVVKIVERKILNFFLK